MRHQHTKSQELQTLIKHTRYARNHFNAGYCIGEVSEKLNLSEQVISELIENYAEPAHSHEILMSSKFFQALVPIYLFSPQTSPGVETAPSFNATGVLINVNSVPFLLTAAHVGLGEDGSIEEGYDIAIRMNNGGIHSLTGGGFRVLREHYSGTYHDTIDVAAYDLSLLPQSPISEHCVPLEPDDVDLNQNCIDGEVITVAGYPTTHQSHSKPPQPFAVTGFADNILPIQKYRYSENVNVSARFGKKSSSSRTSQSSTFSNPKGMSGGMMLSWPKTYEERAKGEGLKLIGIFHSWERKIGTFCGTRIATVIMQIARAYPQHFDTN